MTPTSPGSLYPPHNHVHSSRQPYKERVIIFMRQTRKPKAIKGKQLAWSPTASPSSSQHRCREKDETAFASNSLDTPSIQGRHLLILLLLLLYLKSSLDLMVHLLGSDCCSVPSAPILLSQNFPGSAEYKCVGHSIDISRFSTKLWMTERQDRFLFTFDTWIPGK